MTFTAEQIAHILPTQDGRLIMCHGCGEAATLPAADRERTEPGAHPWLAAQIEFAGLHLDCRVPHAGAPIAVAWHGVLARAAEVAADLEASHVAR